MLPGVPAVSVIFSAANFITETGDRGGFYPGGGKGPAAASMFRHAAVSGQ